MRKAIVYYNKEEAGLLTELDDGSYVFRYHDAYFANPHKPMISLTLPKSRQEYHSAHLFPFFVNLLAEGANLSLQSKNFKLDKRDFFGLLCATARYDAIGPVTVAQIS